MFAIGAINILIDKIYGAFLSGMFMTHVSLANVL